MSKWWKHFLGEMFWILAAPRHHGKSGQQKFAEGQSAVDAQRQTADQRAATADTGAAQGTYSQFEGPVQNSPFYKSLLRQGIQSTSNAYDAARASENQRANAAGFGYTQPINQAGNTQVDTSEARALGAIPDEAMISAAPLSLQAAGGSANLGLGLGQQGLGYGELARGYNEDAYKMQRGRSGLWNQLFQLYAGAAGIPVSNPTASY